MATLLNCESRRLYSWWWDSHISPKNSKWLQENLTDMDSKVKTMIKLIEEDADSFAKRAEMYYKKRPELMKLVEEFYRAYRALAERYDHATGELRQAQRTMAEAFPNHMPVALSEDSPISVSEGDPITTKTPHPIRSLIDLDPDDHSRGSSGISYNFHTIGKNGLCREDSDVDTSKEGLKQLNELFGEGRAGKGLDFQYGEANGSSLKLQMNESVEKDLKIQDLEEKLSKLTIENQNLSSQIWGETKRADSAQAEVEELNGTLRMLKEENEAALHQYQLSLDRIQNLERDIICFREDMNHLHGEISAKNTKLNDAEQRCDFIEITNKSIKLEVESLVKKLEIQENMLSEKQAELENAYIHLGERQNQINEANETIRSLQIRQDKCEDERRELGRSLQDATKRLEETDLKNKTLLDRVEQLKLESQSLTKQKLSLRLLLKKLQEEIFDTKNAKKILEEEVRLLLDNQSAILKELFDVKEEMHNFRGKYQDLIEQIEAVGLHPEHIHSNVRKLQDENVQLKDMCFRGKEEIVILEGKLGNLGKLLEENSLLKISFADANVEVERLKKQVKTLEDTILVIQEENSLLKISFADANVEVERLKKQVKTLEDTILVIQEEKSCILAEKTSLAHLVEKFSHNIEKIVQNSALLEEHLVNFNTELELLEVKSKNLEESCHFIEKENLSLLTDKKIMLSQMECMQSSLDDLNRRVTELELQQSCVEEEKKLALCHISELEVLLNEEKEAHKSFVHLNENRMAILENQIDHLQQVAYFSTKEIEAEQENALSAHIEIFLLQRCIAEMTQKTIWLKEENQGYIEATLDADKLLLQMKQINEAQKEDLKLLMGTFHNLRASIFQLLYCLDTDAGYMYENKIEDTTSIHLISETSEQLQRALLFVEEKFLELNFEKSLNISLMQQIGLEASCLKAEKEFLEEDFDAKTEELNLLEREKYELLKSNEQLREELNAVYFKQEILKSDVDTLGGQLCEAQKACHALTCEKLEILEESQSWKKKFCILMDDKGTLEEKYDVILEERLALDFLSSMLKNVSVEKDAEAKDLCGKLDLLWVAHHDIQDEVQLMNEKMKNVDLENLHLKESIVKLKQYETQSTFLENELSRVSNQNEKLICQIEDGQKSFLQKETELLEVYQKFEAKEFENLELQKGNEHLKDQFDFAKLTNENLEKKISSLLEDKFHQDSQIMHLHQENGQLRQEIRHQEQIVREQEAETDYLRTELQKHICKEEMGEMELEKLYKDLQIYTASASIYEETMFKVVGDCKKEIEKLEAHESHLASELEQRNGESELWENEARELYNELQVSCIQASIFEEKTNELIQKYENLEVHSKLNDKMAKEEKAVRDANYEDLRRKFEGLEEEKERLNCELAAILPLLLSLWDNISSLEVQAFTIPTNEECHEQEVQVSYLKSDSHEAIILAQSHGSTPSRELMLYNLQAKVQAVTHALIESKKLLMQESSKVNAKLAAATRELEELKGKSFSTSARVESYIDNKQHMCESEAKMKDIQLDHVLDSSYHLNGSRPDGIDGKADVNADDQMLELWETSERSISRYVSSSPELVPVGALLQLGHRRIGTDEEEFSGVLPARKRETRRSSQRQRERRKLAMERSNSSSQRVLNLQASVEKLKNRTMEIDRSRRLNGSAYDRLKKQIKETEEAIFQLIDMRSKSARASADEASLVAETRGGHSRRTSEEASIISSERIGRLEFEVQRIQYVLLKLEDEFESKGRKNIERSAGFLLKEYIYGESSGQKKEKRHLCCIKPSTKED